MATAYTDQYGVKHSKQELSDILYLHEQWLNGDPHGVKAEFRYCTFRGFQSLLLCDRNLRKVDFTHASITGLAFDKSDLTEAIFEEAELIGTRMPETNCTRINLMNASIEGQYAGENAILIGANLTGAMLDNCAFDKCDLSNAILDNALTIGDVDFNDCILVGASLKNADLRRASFRNCDLHDADFTNIQYADDAGLYLIKGCDLRNANFTGVNTSSARMSKNRT